MKTYPSAQTLGFFDVELRVPWLEAKGNPLSPSSEAETTDFADDTDNESIPFGRLCTDRFGEFRAEVPLHPCHPCHPWFCIPVFGLSRLAEWVETTDGAGYADSAYRSAASGAEPTARSEAEAMLPQKQVTSRIHERAYRNRPLSNEQKESNRQKSRIRARIEHVFGYLSQSLKGFYLHYVGRRRNAAAIGLINLIYPPAELRAGNLARYESRFRIGTAAGRLKSEDQNPKRPKTKQPRKINRQENTNRGSRYETSHTKNRTATVNPTPKSSFRRFSCE